MDRAVEQPHPHRTARKVVRLPSKRDDARGEQLRGECHLEPTTSARHVCFVPALACDRNGPRLLGPRPSRFADTTGTQRQAVNQYRLGSREEDLDCRRRQRRIRRRQARDPILPDPVPVAQTDPIERAEPPPKDASSPRPGQRQHTPRHATVGPDGTHQLRAVRELCVHETAHVELHHINSSKGIGSTTDVRKPKPKPNRSPTYSPASADSTRALTALAILDLVARQRSVDRPEPQP